MKIVTVATHSHGSFDKLVNNKFGVHIDVLGWGQKWSGFKMKSKLMLEYLENLDDYEIVVYLDGFDSIINRDPSEVEEIFKKMNVPILVSTEICNIGHKLMGWNCIDNLHANAGMYMGYVKHLKNFLTKVYNNKCEDDQFVFNKHYTDFEIDRNNIFFENFSRESEISEKKSDAFFISFPGLITPDASIFRFIKYYTQFYNTEIVLCVILITWLLPVKYKVLPVILFLFLYSYINKSCINV